MWNQGFSSVSSGIIHRSPLITKTSAQSSFEHSLPPPSPLFDLDIIDNHTGNGAIASSRWPEYRHPQVYLEYVASFKSLPPPLSVSLPPKDHALFFFFSKVDPRTLAWRNTGGSRIRGTFPPSEAWRMEDGGTILFIREARRNFYRRVVRDVTWRISSRFISSLSLPLSPSFPSDIGTKCADCFMLRGIYDTYSLSRRHRTSVSRALERCRL